MAIFEIKNYTRYNTEDLLALFDAAESELRGRGLSPQRVESPYRMGVIDAVVSFKDYSPSDSFTTKSHWDNDARRYISYELRRYVKEVETWKPSPNIRLIPPSKIYTNPMEALASTAGDEVIPRAMMEALAERIATLYRGGAEIVALLAGMTVRIMPKRAATVDKAEKERVARDAARKTWGESSYTLGKVRHYTQSFLSGHRSAMNRLKRSKVTLTAEEVALEAAIQEFLNAGDAVKDLLKKAVSCE
jgi:hypothetical protein